jgi:hypothetical protein
MYMLFAIENVESFLGKIYYYIHHDDDVGISFHFRFGSIFNMARLVLDDYRGGYENGSWWQRLFNGYSITTWMVVLNLGSTGLLVSWLMKYADNIVKVNSFFMARHKSFSEDAHKHDNIPRCCVSHRCRWWENFNDNVVKGLVETRMPPWFFIYIL